MSTSHPSHRYTFRTIPVLPVGERRVPGLVFERQFARNPPPEWDFEKQDENERKTFSWFLSLTTVPEQIIRDGVLDWLSEL